MTLPQLVAAGSTVTWTNKKNEAHAVVSDTGLFRYGPLDTNEIHPRMAGTTIVR